MSSVFSHPRTTTALRALQSNIAAKLLFVNVTTMAIPRIVIDSQRNKYAGQETAFYESYSLGTNYALPGALALGTAVALNKVKNPLKINTTGWIGNDYVQALSDIYQKSVAKSGTSEAHKTASLERFLKNSLAQVEGTHSVTSRPTSLKHSEINAYAAEIQKLIATPKPVDAEYAALGGRIAASLGSYDRLRLKAGSTDLPVQPEKLIRHLRYLGGEFQKAHTSTDAATVSSNVRSVAEKLVFTNKAKTGVSLAVVAGLGFAAQFINKAITQARTGQTGFVGYSDFGDGKAHHKKEKHSQDPDNNAGQNAPAFGRLESSQFLPTPNQLKYVIYPIGILGKLLASRALDEARETALKAGFAYFNFLFIPNLIENLAAHATGNKQIFSKMPEEPTEKETGKLERMRQTVKRLNQSTMRSYQDIEVYSKELGQALSTEKTENLKAKLDTRLGGALRKPGQLLKTLDNPHLTQEQRADAITKSVMKELHGIRNISTIAGLTYASLTLGIGLNVLNIYITNKRNAHTSSSFEIPTAHQPKHPKTAPFSYAYPNIPGQPVQALDSTATMNPFYGNVQH